MIINDIDTHTENLFTIEQGLRTAAIDFARDKTGDMRKALRKAALLYAEASDNIDEAMEAFVTKETP